MLTGKKKLILIVGPTASGKTDYSIELAQRYNSPIISCDSRQIYKELRIGTAPPNSEQLLKIRHYFVHSHSVFDYYTAGRYEIEALALLEELFKSHDTLVMVGGSGLYADALCYGLDDFPATDRDLREKLTIRARKEGVDSLSEELLLIDPESYHQIDTANPQRVIRALEVSISSGKKFSSFKKNSKKSRFFEIERVIIQRDREELYERINKRVDIMMESGLLNEAIPLYGCRSLHALKTVGYSELFDYMDGKCSLEEAVELIKRNTRRYAKRQITWFKR